MHCRSIAIETETNTLVQRIFVIEQPRPQIFKRFEKLDTAFKTLSSVTRIVFVKPAQSEV
jgi:hypothetical protein